MPQRDVPERASPGRKPAPTKRALLRMDLRRGTPEQIAEAVRALLDQSALSHEERIQLLGGALVMEALRSHWGDGHTPTEAHALLRRDDPELADAIEAIAPMLLGRAQAHEEAAEALAAVEAMLRRGFA